jgi:hypothetical protein
VRARWCPVDPQRVVVCRLIDRLRRYVLRPVGTGGEVILERDLRALKIAVEALPSDPVV